MSFTLSNDEYNVLNKIACKTKMDCWFYIEQDKSGGDYVLDLEEGNRLSLRDGVAQLVEGIDCKENYDNCDLSLLEKDVFRNLLEELDIAFEIEGFSALPECLTISASDLAVDTDDIYEDSDAISEIISDYLSDTYGFCHMGFTFDVNYNELNEPSSVFVTDIDWDIDAEVTLEDIEDCIQSVDLGNYELDGVEITEEDYVTIYNRLTKTGRALDEIVHEYLIEIREVLDSGLKEPTLDDVIENANRQMKNDSCPSLEKPIKEFNNIDKLL